MDDLISRQAAIDAIRKDIMGGLNYEGILTRLPSVNPQEPKTGYWIDTGSGQMCSRCGEIQHGYDSFRRFCASCGAKMVEPQESEE